ncbi:hypothetical protein K0504_10000 [Neiella marina]|uniref:Uncharacterized protein n=1 Tax=Neiella holothuriorum TaxID=2870530 RepID=A0ABS7EGG9_9GAMM|nr:hypothetical protein [Neiella holothuriorum]MBW8191370.1 hypothetical protein [Neiella holothuriorum]
MRKIKQNHTATVFLTHSEYEQLKKAVPPSNAGSAITLQQHARDRAHLSCSGQRITIKVVQHSQKPLRNIAHRVIVKQGFAPASGQIRERPSIGDRLAPNSLPPAAFAILEGVLAGFIVIAIQKAGAHVFGRSKKRSGGLTCKFKSPLTKSECKKKIIHKFETMIDGRPHLRMICQSGHYKDLPLIGTK